MRLIRWSLDHPAAVLTVHAALVLLGLLALWRLVPVRLTPALESPLVGVLTEAMGKSAEQVERTVTTPLERQLAQVSGLRYVRSVSMDGMSLITLEFSYGYPMDRARGEVAARLSGGMARVVPLDPLNLPVLRVAARAPNWEPSGLARFLETEVAMRLRQVPGVDSVQLFGQARPEVQVVADREALASQGLTLLDVRRALEQAWRAEGQGWLRDVGRSQPVVAPPVSDLEKLAVGPVRLADVARVTRDPSKQAAIYRCNGRPAVELNIFQTADASSPRVVAGVRAALAELARSHPGLEFEEAYDNAHFVGLLVDDVWLELVVAIALTGLVVFLFLGDLRGTLIALTTVPTSLAAAVLLFVPLGLSFNSSTLVGLLLAIGRLVDDAIIDLHSVRHFRLAGHDSREAALAGCAAVRRAVIAATVVICLGVLPLTLAGGLVQDMFVGLVWPFALALLASLGVALTLTPVLCERAYRHAPPPRRAPLEPLLARLEQGFPRVPLGLALASAAAALYLAWMLFPLVGSEMMPLSDTGQLYGVLEARAGTSRDETARLAGQLEEILRKQPEVRRISTEIGPSAGVAGYGVASQSMASLLVTLSDRSQRKRSIWELADAVHAEAWRTIPSLRRLTLREMGSDVMASSMAPVELVIHGDDPARLAWLAEETRNLAQGLAQASTSAAPSQAGLRLVVDPAAAAELGLTEAAVLEQALAALEGTVTMPDGTPVMLAYPENERRSPEDLANVQVVGPTGKRAPLAQVARFEPGPVFSMLEHDGLRRSHSVTGSYRPGGKPSMQLSMDLLMASRTQLPFPSGYDIEQRGDMTQMMDSFARLLRGLALSLVLIYLALALYFSSAVIPAVIMAAIPLAWPGAVAALLLAGQSFSTVSLLGLIVLNGMDVTSSLLVVDAVLQGREPSSRLRPVLMTVLVTLVVMLPLAFFPRAGLDAYAPLATVIVGGLGTSTLLTLGLVPALMRRIRPA